MKRRTITIVIALSSLALAGIIIVQLFWMRHALKTSQEKFDQIVSESMKAVVDKIEKKESMLMISRTFQESCKPVTVPPPPDGPVIVKRGPGYVDKEYSISQSIQSPNDKDLIIRIGGNYILPEFLQQGQENVNLTYSIDIPEMEIIEEQERSIAEEKDLMEEIKEEQKKELQLYIKGLPGIQAWKKFDTTFLSLFDNVEINGPDFHWDKGAYVRGLDSNCKEIRKVKKIKESARKVDDVIQQVVIDIANADRPIQERIDSIMIRNELKKELADRGIRLPFEFGVVTGLRDSVTPVHSKGFKHEEKSNVYRASLFPSEIIPKTDFLLVNFPAKQKHLLKSISLLLIASLVFTIFIIAAFVTSLWIMLQQKKMADIKNDFINNMTHEFKTPIATISLAIDSINNPKVIDNPEVIRNYTKVIREENGRMNSHVEQVLQMALMDRKEIRLQKTAVDMHDLLDKAIENIRLQVENKHGYVAKFFDAKNAIVEGDELHLFNVMMNLLDNANKYSPTFPEIKVFTYNSDGMMMISIQDKGIGMTPYTQKHVFERFYRAGTGNIHTVKGFGLGLSYARAILDLHKAFIDVKSESGKGSIFTISIPFLKVVPGQDQNDLTEV